MNFINKIINAIKNIFIKQNKIIKIEAPKQIQKEENDFFKSLKVDIKPKTKRAKVETIQFVGDGLGIKNKILY